MDSRHPCEQQRDAIVVRVQPYVGPRINPKAHTVTLGSLSGRAAIPAAAGRWGHLFVVDPAGDKPGIVSGPA